MKLTTIILITTLLQVSAASFAQKMTMVKKSASLDEVFREIRKQTGYDVFLISNNIKSGDKVSVNFNNAPLEKVMDQLLDGKDLEFTVEKKTIIIREKTADATPESTPTVVAYIDFQGKVVNEQGSPLAGATITVKGTNRRVFTDKNGQFLLRFVDDKAIITISFIGYASQEIKPRAGQGLVTIKMALAESRLNDVVVTGTGINRKRESFTGSAETFSGEQLKVIGNKNVLESLKTLDPSFIMVENNAQGSNPNNLPNIEIRGKTSISNTNLNDQYSSDPNQPLFILDGFESTLQAIYDLDMNRVASITILKDAASTALYGSKASNGVVVVETKRPVAGELRVNYSADFSFDLPDLSSYNLMNASEKLQFEKLSGVYNTPQTQWLTDSVYNAKLANIKRGVNTYWLHEPVQMGFSERHSVNMSGGSNELLFGAGINFRNQDGIMKGSDRNTWGGNFDLTYRKNKFNITNILSLSNLISNDSPYGSFSNFARANPYYTKTNADGTIPMFLDPGQTNTPNPLYNASLFSISQNKSFSLSDNLQAIYSLSNTFRVQGGVSLGKGNTDGVIFVPPDNTAFAGVDTYQKGSYTSATSNNNFYSANLMLSYAKVINKNQITANVRGDLQSSTGSAISFQAVGFPYGTNGNPSFAYSYAPSSRPSASTSTSRSTGILGSVNYAYDQRYLFDATYRLDGASTFGSNKLYKPFSAVGIGWNIYKEAFLKKVRWIDLLKLRANIGYTGNENLGQFTSTSVYTFQQGSNRFGQGLDMSSLGNPNLDWQNTLQQSYGIDFGFFRGRISGYVEYFDKHTDPLAISANGALPSSAGINSNYVINVGNLSTKGYDFNLRLSPIYDLKRRIILTVGVSGQHNQSSYGGLGNSLSALNTLEQNSQGLLRYKDGYSPDDIWAVVSRGIDPATGNEIFQKKDGTLNFLYDPADIVKVGNTQPKLQGIINTNFTYKSFNVGANIRYSMGGYVFNSALYDKVENISATNLIYNQDRRALYDRWQKPGDVAQFKAISLTSTTPMSSRFVEKNNFFDGESINAGWRTSSPWIRKLGLQMLSVNCYVNDIFRLESIKSERGTAYPFSRSASVSLNASF